MNNYYIASCSCGKDSLAMILRLMEEKKPLNEIIFYDTGMEFQAIYDNWKELCTYANACGIKTTILKPECPFVYKMFDKLVKNKDGSGYHNGYSWCGGRCRWGTTDKLNALDKYCENINAFCYVGIAVDETARLIKERKPYKLFPLADLSMTEADCLAYCREKNINWIEPTTATESGFIDLYDILDRVSCWCCGNKNLWELYNIWKYFYGTYWKKLKDLQQKTSRPMKYNKYTVFDLEEKFENGYIPEKKRRCKENCQLCIFDLEEK